MILKQLLLTLHHENNAMKDKWLTNYERFQHYSYSDINLPQDKQSHVQIEAITWYNPARGKS